MKRPVLVLFWVLIFHVFSAAQVKYEREYRVSPKDVPAHARAFSEKAFPGQKIKWYKEEGLGFFSFEAKVKRYGAGFSVEFDSLGMIEDVEMLLSFSEIEEPTRKRMEAALGKMFSKYKVQRVQRQWTGQEQALGELISTGATGLPFVIRYELVARGKKDKATRLYELLFDERGKLLETLEIIPRNTDILDF